MDTESRWSQESPQPTDIGHASNSSVHHPDQLEAHCILCGRIYMIDIEVTEGFETMSTCGECTFLLLEDRETPVRGFHQRTHRERSRYSRSSESIEDLFSQQFSQLINLVRQNESQPNGDTASTVVHHASSHTTQSSSGRWRRTLSDSESEGFNDLYSRFGESDSNVSFGGSSALPVESDAVSFSAHGWDSDVSVDGQNLLDRNMFNQLDDANHVSSEMDIDPMGAGLDQWDSYDTEEDGEWEEGEEETVETMEPDRWRIQESRYSFIRNFIADMEETEIPPPYVGNSGDYLDARGFQEFLNQLVETDNSRRGAPPAAASFVGSLPCVVIHKEHEKHGSLVCAVCKDPLFVDTEANQLPCSHLYHPSCILPWLSARNSCPVCRYELPTDDVDYEEGKRNTGGGTEIHEILDPDPSESSSDIMEDSEVVEAHVFSHGNVDQEGPAVTGSAVNGSNREDTRRGWLFLAAAPIVSIVGIVLVLWFRNPLAEGRVHFGLGEPNQQQLHRSSGTSLGSEHRENRSRRWWSFF